MTASLRARPGPLLQPSRRPVAADRADGPDEAEDDDEGGTHHQDRHEEDDTEPDATEPDEPEHRTVPRRPDHPRPGHLKRQTAQPESVERAVLPVITQRHPPITRAQHGHPLNPATQPR